MRKKIIMILFLLITSMVSINSEAPYIPKQPLPSLFYKTPAPTVYSSRWESIGVGTPTPTPTIDPFTQYILQFWTSKDSQKNLKIKKSGKDMLIDVRFMNVSDCETIDALDIAIYCTNAYDEVITPDDEEDGFMRFFSINTTIKPEGNKYIGYNRMKGCASAKHIYVAMVRFHVKDGDTYSFKNTKKQLSWEQYQWKVWDVD